MQAGKPQQREWGGCRSGRVEASRLQVGRGAGFGAQVVRTLMRLQGRRPRDKVHELEVVVCAGVPLDRALHAEVGGSMPHQRLLYSRLAECQTDAVRLLGVKSLPPGSKQEHDARTACFNCNAYGCAAHSPHALLRMGCMPSWHQDQRFHVCVYKWSNSTQDHDFRIRLFRMLCLRLCGHRCATRCWSGTAASTRTRTSGAARTSSRKPARSCPPWTRRSAACSNAAPWGLLSVRRAICVAVHARCSNGQVLAYVLCALLHLWRQPSMPLAACYTGEGSGMPVWAPALGAMEVAAGQNWASYYSNAEEALYL